MSRELAYQLATNKQYRNRLAHAIRALRAMHVGWTVQSGEMSAIYDHAIRLMARCGRWYVEPEITPSPSTTRKSWLSVLCAPCSPMHTASRTAKSDDRFFPFTSRRRLYILTIQAAPSAR